MTVSIPGIFDKGFSTRNDKIAEKKSEIYDSFHPRNFR